VVLEEEVLHGTALPGPRGRGGAAGVRGGRFHRPSGHHGGVLDPHNRGHFAPRDIGRRETGESKPPTSTPRISQNHCLPTREFFI